MAIQVRPEGPIPARVMIVGEAPGAEEEARGSPFGVVSGTELNRMLQEAGLTRSESFVTNVCRSRPPQNDITTYIAQSKKEITNAHIAVRDKMVLPPIRDGMDLLAKEIQMVQPKVIIALGNVALWALTGRWGITKWRGSALKCDLIQTDAIVIPSYHPAAILRQWDWRAIGVNDLRRARRYRDGNGPTAPRYNFILRPSFNQACATLDWIKNSLDSGDLTRISFDIETRGGRIACAGLSWSYTDAICLPLMCVERREGFWLLEEELGIVWRLREILCHKRVEVVGQNIIYDSQYTWRHWGFVPRVTQDTMISQHSLFSDLPKSLAFIASMYCDYYVYWKDEGKDWASGLGEDQLWHYNCLDCVYTLEVADVLLRTTKQMNLESVAAFQQSMFWPVLKAMQQGVRIDIAKRNLLIAEVQEEIARREQFILDLLGHPLNPRSPVQMKSLFYDDLHLPIQMTRSKKGVPGHATLDDEALQKLSQKEPLVKPLINSISDIRTLGIFLGNFLSAPLDTDGRMRCAYNIGGSASGKSAPKSYRLSSSENAFGSGTNLQNIPSEKSKSLGKAAARGSIPGLGDPYQFPNIRSMFIPDPGYTWFDGDLDRADLQVVVWESDDQMLKSALRMGADIHLMNAYVLSNKEPPPLEELVETHPRYATHRGPFKHAREFAKVFCHGTNYGGGARTMAAHTGRSVADIERAQRIWFGAHPGIKKWHDRVHQQISKYHFVENKFGYRWYIFSRLDAVLPEAIAWIPQSTVSIVINKIWNNIHCRVPEAEVLLQVHDSLCGQIPKSVVASAAERIREAARVIIPYEDPLVIPFHLKWSEISWGECE